MLARHAVLLTLPSDGNRPSWSYHHTGTLPRLISFVSRPYANTGGGGVFFPFWYKTIGGGDANSLHYSSSFFSHSCALFCAFLHFPRIQPFSFQSFPHSSPKNTPGGGTLRLLCPLLPCSIANLTLHAFSRWPELANRPGRLFQRFPFNLQLWTLNLLFALLPMGHGARIMPFSLPPYFVPFLTSFFHYNRCASIRGTNEFQPASRRDPNRLRAPLLGRQYYRTLRACLILWRAGRSGHLSPRSSQVFRRAGRRPDRLFRSCRVVSADSGRQPRGPLRVPPLSRLCLSGSGVRLLSLGFARGFVDGSGTICSPLIVAGALRLVDPRARSRHRQALRGGNHGSRFQGKCSLAGLLHLLHTRQCWRNSRSHRGVSCAAFDRDGKCLSRLRHQRPAHVFRCPLLLPRTVTLRRTESCQCRRSAEEYVHRARQFAFHAVPSDFFGFLDCVLAGVYYAPPLHTRLCQPELGRRLAPHLRPSSSHSPSDPGELSHAGNQDVSSHDVWIAHHQPCVDHSCR